MQINRAELGLLSNVGYSWNQPWEITDQFERKVADYFGANYAIAVDCCTHSLELSLRLLNQPTVTVSVPENTYMSVPMMLEKIRQPWTFSKQQWEKYYYIDPLPIIDAATLWERDSYISGTLMCISFQFKKHIPIGRGGMILTDNFESYSRLQRMCRDGRDRCLLQNDDVIKEIGYHYYMTPEDSARGILLFDQLKDNPSKAWSWQNYKQLTDYPLFEMYRAGVPA